MRIALLASALLACKSEAPPTVVIAPPPSANATVASASGTLLPAPAPSGGPDDACRVDSDCTWGEIPHDILQATDCMCLLGCPGLAQSTSTASRRQAQYGALCKPGMDGRGHGCPIDDCAPPPPIRCVANKCAAKR